MIHVPKIMQRSFSTERMFREPYMPMLPDYLILTHHAGIILGICVACGRFMNRVLGVLAIIASVFFFFYYYYSN